MAEKIRENDVVALLIDIPERRLHRGAIGTIVEIVAPSRADSGYLLVEFENGTQADFDDTTDIVKLNFSASRMGKQKQTLEEWAGRSRQFALVFTDIVDSTRLANELGDESWIEVLSKHVAQARLLMKQHDCHEIKMIGDSFMVVFRTALEALDFVLALEEIPGDPRITIRAGIHVGSARLVENDIFGNMVNYTKRVESAQKMGGITISDVAKREISSEKAKRHSDLGFQLMQPQFKGYDEIETVWWVITPKVAARVLGEALGHTIADIFKK